MPVLGAHLSVAGGLRKAAEAAAALGCGTVQIFTKSPNAWEAKPLADADVRAFRAAVAAAGLRFPTAHDSYLINLAAPDDAAFRKSVAALAVEVERAEALGLSYLVTHPGAHTGSGEDAGLARVAAGLDEVRGRCPGVKVKVLLETTAGQGTCLGHRFEHLRTILDHVTDADWLGVCLDTCHVFAAGYGLATADEYAATVDEFDRVVGLSRLELFHLNDSVKGRGSRVDRHAGIGLGMIGPEPFRRLVTDTRFAHLPMVLETPKEGPAGEAMDPVNLAVLQGFLADAPVARAG
ncbi:MAG: deoxyribonuclease IV [Isosphaera sp.]|nr:deoxyribonuclease IV [Isosphaera sp.]